MHTPYLNMEKNEKKKKRNIRLNQAEAFYLNFFQGRLDRLTVNNTTQQDPNYKLAPS